MISEGLSDYKVNRSGELTLYGAVIINGAQADETLSELHLLINKYGFGDELLTHFILTGELINNQYNENYKLN